VETNVTVAMVSLSQKAMLAVSYTVKPVLAATQGKHKKVAALRQWLLSGGEYQYKIKVWEHFVWLLDTGWLLNNGDG